MLRRFWFCNECNVCFLQDSVGYAVFFILRVKVIPSHEVSVSDEITRFNGQRSQSAFLVVFPRPYGDYGSLSVFLIRNDFQDVRLHPFDRLDDDIVLRRLEHLAFLVLCFQDVNKFI